MSTPASSGTGSLSLLIGCEFVHSSAYDTPAVFQVQPRHDQNIEIIDEKWDLRPEGALRHYVDLYGNPCLRTVIPAGESVLSYEAHLTVPDAVEDADEDAEEVPPGDLPDDVLLYTLPSRYCLPDVLGFEAWSRFGNAPRGYQRVQAICDYVNTYLKFQYGSTNALSTAADVHASGYGVCRDFTHLAISLCRALNIPARYVFGYLPELAVQKPVEIMDFAAWMEVWLGDRWYTFDPRNNARRKGRVLIGRGRDASDVAMATTFGAPWLKSMEVVARQIPTA